MKSGIELVKKEREKQILKWGDMHDNDHSCNEIAIRSAEMLVNGTRSSLESRNARDCYDDWGLIEKHKHDRIKMLTIAGALVCAEIDRLLREARQ